jgi:hypothetical protein
MTVAAKVNAGASAQNNPHSIDVRKYGSLPLIFEANQGQANPQVKFIGRAPGYSVFLTQNEIYLMPRHAAPESRHSLKNGLLRSASNVRSHEASALGIRLVGSRSGTDVRGVNELPGRRNYFIGNEPKDWHVDVPTYAKVLYGDAYRGIDLLCYGNPDQLEYDFVVNPGANPASIRLAVEHGAHAHRDAAGNVTLDTAGGGHLILHKPRVYQQTTTGKHRISGDYVVLASDLIGFRIGPYNRDKPLVIDPTLQYGTYLGGSGSDLAQAIALDSSGFAYVTGNTSSTNFPVTTGSFKGESDVFVTKIDTTKYGAASLVYSTLFGGASDQTGYGIAVDSTGSVYVVGSTDSPDFPITPNALLQTYPNASGTGFLVKFTPAATLTLTYSTLLGGSNNDFANAIAVAGTVAYVTGQTTSSNFPTTSSAFQSALASVNGNAFLSAIDTSKSGQASLLYSSYFGGSGSNGDTGNAIAIDTTGAYIVGGTSSTNLPTTSGAFSQTYGGGVLDAFIAKFDTTKSRTASLLYSTYLGGANGDAASGIAVSAGVIYVAGDTYLPASPAFPTTSGAYQSTSTGTEGAFVAKIDPTQSGAASLLYSTLLGGSGADFARAIALDSSGNVYITGDAGSSNFPVTGNAYQTLLKGTQDAFVAEFDTTKSGASTLIYSTYFGGSSTEDGYGIAVDTSGAAYIVGDTSSTDLPTQGGLQSSLKADPTQGNTNGFLAKIGDGQVVTPPPGSMTVNKTLAPSQDPGQFKLEIDGSPLSQCVGDGGTTGPQSVASQTVHRVSEAPCGSTSLKSYRTLYNGSCNLRGALFVPTGGSAQCTITNLGTANTCPQVCQLVQAACAATPNAFPANCPQLEQQCQSFCTRSIDQQCLVKLSNCFVVDPEGRLVVSSQACLTQFEQCIGLEKRRRRLHPNEEPK